MKLILFFSALMSFNNYAAEVETQKSEGVIIDPYGNQITITYENINGLAIMEGDILLGNFNELSEDTIGTMANKIIVSSKHWSNQTLVYDYATNLSSNAMSVFEDAMDDISANTYISFKKKTTESNYVYVRSDTSGICNSYVGMIGGKQDLNLGAGCHTKGTAIHEILHALGIAHEQSRADRDSYINIHWDNITAGKESNFQMSSSSYAPHGTYDYQSIMHYGSDAFSSGGSTITKKDGSIINENRDYLSQIDTQGLISIYPDPTCSSGDTETSTTYCPSGTRTCETGTNIKQCNNGIWGDWEQKYRPICVNRNQYCP